MVDQWRAQGGDQSATLFRAVYASLHRPDSPNAAPRRGRSGTAALNEAFLKKLAADDGAASGQARPVGDSADAMRRLLVEFARRQGEGEAVAPISLDEATGTEVDIEALDAALTRLDAIDPQQAAVVSLKFFGGMALEDIAQALGITPAAATREWRLARGWLKRELESE